MKAVLSLLLLCAVAASAFTEAEYKKSFVQWMQKHEKAYSQAEFQQRYTIFKSNMDYVNEWNAGGSGTVLGLTRFADLTNAEYQETYLMPKIVVQPDESAEVVQVGAPNATVDWRTANPPIITPIKNQGECGSCWSFSTTGSVEGAHAQSTKELVSLSEQNLMDCATSGNGYPPNDGCNGGLMTAAMEYIIKNNGIDTEAFYPYKGKNGNCHYSTKNVGATISSYKNVQQGSETGLEAAVTIRPVSIAIDASLESFQLYESGIYWDAACNASMLDHGVLAAGFGVNTTGAEYWIVKNSWGTQWGMDGWIYMARNRDNACGIASMPTYPIV